MTAGEALALGFGAGVLLACAALGGAALVARGLRRRCVGWVRPW